ncbi:1-aminocyclopropane-1-carboxylate deaminase/D-cysteine desulfhydrase [Mesorhizobium sp. INR15]|uniref:1-aminocyclopropane-1-carboxylate deaminase/D-cysteine desulfhydrase n=1 Tax=Mesorhizobium sp. INR15 TaxID=2654248 RepID=UPI00189673C6|nr:pyridoxal-phosphate dependent enzyme [Mesorhizobium sp. INR15]
MSRDPIDAVRARIAALKRHSLVSLPTPLERAERLGQSLRIDLLIKRDDLMGLGAGGNKLRKLEFIVGKALDEGYDTLLTTGGIQSNHARQTAAAAARQGLACELHLRGRSPDNLTGNVLLSSILGAELHYHEDADYAEIDRRMAARAEILSTQGRRALVIPLGGGTAEGTVGYVLAVAEIMRQISDGGAPDLFVVAGGTGSTAAGLSLGTQLFSPGTSVLAVSASWKKDVLSGEIARHRRAAAELLGIEDKAAVWVDDSFVGPGYSQVSEAGRTALLTLARSDGILLDTTYTAKAMSGLIALVRAGRIAPDAKVVFWHTGGTPELFTRTTYELAI